MSTYLRAYYHCKPSESDALSERLFAKGVWSLTEHHEDTITRIEALSDVDIDHSDAQNVETVTDHDWLTDATCTQEISLVMGDFEIIPMGQSARFSDKTPLYINPTGVFGDGHHPSTVLCGQALQSVTPTPQHVLDIGTGSGILALIAKHRFPTARVTGIDIEATSIEIAQANSRVNQLVCDFFHTDAAQYQPLTQPDLIVANLPTDLQLLLAPHIATWLAPGGQVVVSGVWETWETTVEDAYLKEGFQIFSTDTQESWCGFVFCKRKNTTTP